MDRGTVKIDNSLYKDVNLQIIFGVALMVVLGVSSIAPALPDVAKGLKITDQETALLITIFTLPGMVLIPVLGFLADRLGRKEVLVPSLLLFAFAGTACGFARDFSLMLTLRFLQGAGAASLGALIVTIIGDLYSGRNRAAAIGLNESALSTGEAVFPFIGGSMALLGWYFPFFLPIVALPLAFICLFWLDAPKPKQESLFKDYVKGAFTGIKNRRVAGLLMAIVITFVIHFGIAQTYFPFLIKNYFQTSSFVIGLVMTIMFLTAAFTASQIGKLVDRFRERSLLKAAYVIYALALTIIPLVSNIWVLLLPAIMYGVAQGINIPIFLTLLTDSAPKEYRAGFISINWTVLKFGQTIGPVLMGMILGIWGIGSVFFAGAILAIFMFVVVILLI
ncbi:MAG: MFS transporter [Archaeoglobaceae archaeon]